MANDDLFTLLLKSDVLEAILHGEIARTEMGELLFGVSDLLMVPQLHH